ncbi:MAG: hypothetical protein QG675_561 [Patescibacteria group bacterium]|jgi:hypothetical protein|nr:hypothetical protein [Patescibacteria group bacterium]
MTDQENPSFDDWATRVKPSEYAEYLGGHFRRPWMSKVDLADRALIASFLEMQMPDGRTIAHWLDELPEAEDEIRLLRAENEEARHAINEALGCAFIHHMCECGDTVNCGVCHMVARLQASSGRQS